MIYRASVSDAATFRRMEPAGAERHRRAGQRPSERERTSQAPYSLGVGRLTFSVRCFSSMRIDIVTLFPEICRAPLSESIMKRAQENRIVELHIHNLRDWTTDKHHVVDDAPFGGGQGMVMKPEPIFAAVEDLKSPNIATSKSKSTNSPDVACRPSVRSRDGDGSCHKSRIS